MRPTWRRCCSSPSNKTARVSLRYPKTAAETIERDVAPVELGRAEVLQWGRDGTIISWGALLPHCIAAAQLLKEQDGLQVGVVNARFLKPLDAELIAKAITETRFVVTVEEAALPTGFGSAVLEAANDAGLNTSKIQRLGAPEPVHRTRRPRRTARRSGTRHRRHPRRLPRNDRPKRRVDPQHGVAAAERFDPTVGGRNNEEMDAPRQAAKFGWLLLGLAYGVTFSFIAGPIAAGANPYSTPGQRAPTGVPFVVGGSILGAGLGAIIDAVARRNMRWWDWLTLALLSLCLAIVAAGNEFGA